MTARVLAAEDSPTQAAVLRSHLEAAGFEVATARDGAEALALLQRAPFDVVVSDVVMPDVDGYQLCREAKQRDPDLPVMLLTSLDDPMDVVNALLSGADSFLRKPYEAEDLVERVRNMVSVGPEPPAEDDGADGVDLFVSGRRLRLEAGREQIMGMLVSTFDGLVTLNKQLRAREEDLAAAKDHVAARLADVELERQRLSSVLGSLPQAMSVVDRDGTIVHVNEPLASLVGRSVDELVGASSDQVFDFVDHSGKRVEPGRRAIRQCLDSGLEVVTGTAFDLFVVRPDGTRGPVMARCAPITDRNGTMLGAVNVLEDIATLLAHDPVTGLPGHGVLVDRLQASLETTEANGAVTGLLVVKLDRFDRIREALPTAQSEQVIARLAEELGRELESDSIQQRSRGPFAAYLGNDQLAVVLPCISEEADAIIVGELLADSLAGVVDVGGVEVAMTVSVAVAVGHHPVEASSLVSAVGAAARRASTEGGGRVISSDPVLHAEVLGRLRRESDLRYAIASDGLSVYYQPQIDLTSGDPVAVEALVRWHHPELGLIGAGDIIPLAIESDLIAPLGWSVLEQACRQAAEWRRGGLALGEGLRLSVNLAAEQLLEPDVRSRIEAVLAGSGLDPRALVLEVTEGSVMRQPEVAARRLAGIRDLGVHVAIDDFGTGHSSLLQLRELPVDVLKIDQTFVGGLLHRAVDVAIVSGTVSLARALGLKTVAEGVETGGQLVDLRRLGCDLGQGYHWARPMPAGELASWWEDYAGHQPRG